MAETDNPFEKYPAVAPAAPPPAMAVAPPAEDNPFLKYAAPSDISVLESLARGAVEGATFGFDDKLGMDKERREASRKANPWTHFMGMAAGSVAPMVASGGLGTIATAARAPALLTRAARAPAALLAPGEMVTLGQSLGQGAKLGTVYGGLSGAGHADVQEGDTYGQATGKRLGGAAIGAGEGAVLGPIVGGIGHGVLGAARSIAGARAAARAETENAGAGALTAVARGL